MATITSSPPAVPRAGGGFAERVQELRTKIAYLEAKDWTPCDCPPGCTGHGVQRPVPFTPRNNRPRDAPRDIPSSTPSGGSEPSALSTPGDGPRGRDGVIHPIVNLRLPVCQYATLLAEARGSINNVELRRTRVTGTLRMSLQVHSDIFKYQSRLGYYGELYFKSPGRREEHVGFISAWRIWKLQHPNAQDPVWVSEFILSVMSGEGDDVLKQTLRRVYNEDGNPEEEIRDIDLEVYNELLKEKTDNVFIPMIWITPRFSGQGLIDHAFRLFYRLTTGGTLPPVYNINNSTVFLLEPGIPYADELARVWWQVVVPFPGDGEYNHGIRVRNMMARAYARNGYSSIMRRGEYINIMARVVRPVPRDPDDFLMLPPDVPPLAPHGMHQVSIRFRPPPLVPPRESVTPEGGYVVTSSSSPGS